MPRPGRFIPRKDPVPIVYEAGWAPGPVWTGAENLTLTGIRSLGRPTRSELLYQLHYNGDKGYFPFVAKVLTNVSLTLVLA